MSKYTVHGVLAGAYKNGNLKNLLTHASIDGGTKALCNRVKEYSLCDMEETGEPTCEICLTRSKKL